MEEWAQRLDASSWAVHEVETAGSHDSRWLIQPGNSDEEGRWLHKFTVTPANGIEQGEDWAEVVSTQVAKAIGIPCAKTRLCVREGARGSISQSVRPRGYDLWEGNLALETAAAPGYFPHLEGSPGRDPERPQIVRPGHNIPNIRDALAHYDPPPGFEAFRGWTAFEVFTGYLILDALVANRDRHEQNWAVLVPVSDTDRAALAPSYDHASSLGFNLPEDTRARLLSEPELLTRWLEKGTAYRFEHLRNKPVTLVEHAVNALGECSSEARSWWADRLHTADLAPILDVVRRGDVDALSHPASTFAVTILGLNHRRLCDALPTDA